MRLAGQRPLMFYVTVTLMTFDKRSNGRRVEVESYSCNRWIRSWIWGSGSRRV